MKLVVVQLEYICYAKIMMKEAEIGILLTNLGTPDAPTTKAVRRYLRQFLSDPRMVEIPQLFWKPILYGVILPFRSGRSAKLYQKVWTEDGSPLRQIGLRQAQNLQQKFDQHYPGRVIVELGMRYGKPSIEQAIQKMQRAQVKKLMVLPLYPQYSAVTTGSTFDAVSLSFSDTHWLPSLRMLNQYAGQHDYINALANSIRSHWAKHPRGEKLLFSFHGIPQRRIDQGDPYEKQCYETANAVANVLGLDDDAWQVVFQSRFGKAQWLQPYCDKTLEALPGEGVNNVDVICPGFSADCLETLEEMAIRNKKLFEENGGKQFHYIPALNDSEDHINALKNIIVEHCQGWLE